MARSSAWLSQGPHWPLESEAFRICAVTRNAIGKDPSGLNALCDVLKCAVPSSKPLSLSLSRHLLGRSNLTVGHVDLRNNRINNVGAKYIGEMLASNTTVPVRACLWRHTLPAVACGSSHDLRSLTWTSPGTTWVLMVDWRF